MSNEPYEITYEDLHTLWRQNQMDMQECEHVTQTTNRGETYYANDGHPGNEKIDNFFTAFYKEVLYRDMKTSGHMMQYPHGIVIMQGRTNSFYRGENQIFPRSQATLYRSLEKIESEEAQRAYRFVTKMRIAEFGIFLCRLGIVQFWLQNYGSVLFEPLAQHYGLETEWLDVTSDFEVALFFATCYWDDQKKTWLPLTKEQTEKNQYTQYGVIFHIPEWQARSNSLIKYCPGQDEEYLVNDILPIGYQPFMRCHSQHAYGIHMEKPFPLQEDYSFEKLRFRHNEKLSRAVYERMDGGKKIYPQEGLNDFSDVIQKIKSSTIFSREAFESVLNREGIYSSEAEAKKVMSEIGIAGKPVEILPGDLKPAFGLSRQRINALNRKYIGFSVEKAYGIQLTQRLVYRPPA